MLFVTNGQRNATPATLIKFHESNRRQLITFILVSGHGPQFINQQDRYTNYRATAIPIIVILSDALMRLPHSLGFLVSLLDHNEEEVLVGSDEDFLSASAHSKECHVIHRVNVTHNAPCLHSQVSDVVGNMLRCRGSILLVPLRDDTALIIDDKQSANT